MSLIVDSITKCFGSVVALDGVSFSVEPGRIFGLLGANGAGKTTCMRIVLDILRADAGSVTWEGCGAHGRLSGGRPVGRGAPLLRRRAALRVSASG